MKPPGGGSMHVLGARVHWADFGGPAQPEALCVLVHGMGGSSVNWESLTPLLTDRFRCVAFDLAGFGLTDPGPRTACLADNTDLLAAFVAALRPAYPGLAVIVVGNSMGGLICARYAAASPPGEVAGVVLLDTAVPPAYAVPGPGGILAAGLYVIPPIGRLASRARRSLRTPAQNVQDTLRLCTVDPARVDPDVVALHLPVAQRRAARPQMDGYYAQAARSIIGDLARRSRTDAMYATVDAPVLLVHGVQDRLVPFSGALRMARRNPAWTFLPLADSGHLPMLEHPRALAAHIHRWWSCVYPGASGTLDGERVVD